VPDYLEERKMQWAQAETERLDNMEDPNVPAGMKLMDEDERRDTLRVLRDSLEQAKNQLFKLPLTLETPSQVSAANVPGKTMIILLYVSSSVFLLVCCSPL
jgi:hypothetical protein